MQPLTDDASFNIDAWRKQQAERAERFHDRLAGVIAKKEAALDLPDFASVSGRRTIKVSFAPKVKSWHYRSYEMHWQTFVALMSVANKKEQKDWCDALTLADLQPDDRANKGYARAETGNVNGMDVVGLDYDKGHLTREQLEARVRETGLEAVVSESYSYATTQMSVTVATRNAKGDVQLSALGKRAVALDINDWHTISGALVKTHLVEDEGYSADALGDVKIVEVVEDVDDDDVVTIQLRIEHAPLPKLRVFVLLDARFERARSENNDKFKARYVRDVYGPLSALVAPHSDPTCKSIERRWYCRGHRPDHRPAPPTHIEGKPFTVLSVAAPAEPERVKAPKGEIGGQQRQDWKGFQAADAAADLITGAVDKRGDGAMPLVSVDCPFREFHNSTKSGKNQLFLFNALNSSLVPVVKCHSGSCQNAGHSWEEYLSALFAGRDVSEPKYWLRHDRAADAKACGWTMPKGDAFIVPWKHIESALDQMNELWAVVGVGAKTRYVRRGHDGQPEFFDKSNLTNMYQASKYEVVVSWKKDGTPQDTDHEPFAQLWLSWVGRRQFSAGYGFFPDGKAPEGCYNMWRGLGVEPKRGSWKRLQRHVWENVCQRNPDHFRWLITWLAQMFQQPATKPGTHLVLIGKEGVGKSKLGEWIATALQSSAMTLTSGERLTGRFNAHFESLLFAMAEEVFWAGDRKAEGVIKALATANIMDYERKGLDPVSGRNYTRLMIASNNPWVVPAWSGGRRWFVLEVGDKHEKDFPYFAAIDEEMQNGGLEAMLFDLMHSPLARTVNVRDVPITPWLIEQRKHSADPKRQWLRDAIERGAFVCQDYDDDATDTTLGNAIVHLYDDGVSVCERRKVMRSAKPYFDRAGMPASEATVAFWLEKELGDLFKNEGKRLTVKTSDGKKMRPRTWEFAPLPKLQAFWLAKYGEDLSETESTQSP